MVDTVGHYMVLTIIQRRHHCTLFSVQTFTVCVYSGDIPKKKIVLLGRAYKRITKTLYRQSSFYLHISLVFFS